MVNTYFSLEVDVSAHILLSINMGDCGIENVDIKFQIQISKNKRREFRTQDTEFA